MSMFRLIAVALSLLLATSPTYAQWQTTKHSVPLGQGKGITGFGSAVPGTAGLPVVSNGPTSDPSFGVAGPAGGGTGANNSTNAAGDVLASNGTNGSFIHTALASALNAGCALVPSVCVSVFGYSNVAWYGAVCDGVTSDTAAIQAAVNAANANFGGTIVFPARGCAVASPGLDFTNMGNITLHGQGAGRALFLSNTRLVYTGTTGSLFKLDGSQNIIIEKMGLEYSSATYNGDLIDLRQDASGIQGTLNTTVRDCFLFGPSGTANSFLRLGASGGPQTTLNTRLERCLISGAITGVLGGVAANNVHISDNWFDKNDLTVTHIATQGEGWVIDSSTFEPTTSSGSLCNNITAVGVTNGLLISGDTFNDCTGASGEPINLTGAVVNGLTVTGSPIQGGAASINAGHAVGVSITGNALSSGNVCNVIVNAATSVTVLSNSNLGSLVCTLPASGNYIIDATDGAATHIH